MSERQSRPAVSIVIPVYNEEAGIPSLQRALEEALPGLGEPAEVIYVDDHSLDGTPQALKAAIEDRPAFRYLRLARNRGSHIAILAGFAHARGDCSVFLAADLQDPPALIGRLVSEWKQGWDVVWAVREKREGLSAWEGLTSAVYHRLLHTVASGNVPPHGSDFALLDRRVVRALLDTCALRPSIGIDIARLGFRQTRVPYTKQERKFGRSKWTLRRKLGAVADAMIQTRSPLLITWALAVPAGVLGVAAALGALVLVGVGGQSVPWEMWLAILLVLLGACLLFTAGICGEYLSRLLEAAGRPPLYWIEDSLHIENTEDTGGGHA